MCISHETRLNPEALGPPRSKPGCQILDLDHMGDKSERGSLGRTVRGSGALGLASSVVRASSLSSESLLAEHWASCLLRGLEAKGLGFRVWLPKLIIYS